ncbi:hypothetical protein BTM29_05590 [Companilactobacillus allii]|uniref:Uncharacterized protein n=2 Tax=Companilactobacillus allii TaxID=1847728 RepID=A0A1P8Q2L4_9LACO|nr:hypothetical protein BTM29_05590 [Companilactobacillus allii]
MSKREENKLPRITSMSLTKSQRQEDLYNINREFESVRESVSDVDGNLSKEIKDNYSNLSNKIKDDYSDLCKYSNGNTNRVTENLNRETSRLDKKIKYLTISLVVMAILIIILAVGVLI